jgi:glycine cleavage system regulatory protein
MSTSIISTVVCDDRPGIVETLSQVLGEHGGNWAESSMMSLAGKFAGILLAELPDENADAFMQALAALQDDGLQIVCQASVQQPGDPAARPYSIEFVGQDHPGIVHEITEVLARHGINVQELETTVQSASMSAEKLFIAHARILIPAEVSLEQLQAEMEELANELMVDIKLEE